MAARQDVHRVDDHPQADEHGRLPVEQFGQEQPGEQCGASAGAEGEGGEAQQRGQVHEVPEVEPVGVLEGDEQPGVEQGAGPGAGFVPPAPPEDGVTSRVAQEEQCAADEGVAGGEGAVGEVCEGADEGGPEEPALVEPPVGVSGEDAEGAVALGGEAVELDEPDDAELQEGEDEQSEQGDQQGPDGERAAGRRVGRRGRNHRTCFPFLAAASRGSVFRFR